MSIATTAIRYLEPILAPTLAGLRGLEKFLGPNDDWVEDDRRFLYEIANKFLEPLGRPTITEKSDKDYVTTVDATPNEVEIVLHSHGYQRNLLSTRKYREHHDGGRQWAVGSWVLDPAETGWQHHVFLFPSKDGGTDVYAHTEPSVRDPSEHHKSDEIEYGTAMELYHFFEQAGMEYGQKLD